MSGHLKVGLWSHKGVCVWVLNAECVGVRWVCEHLKACEWTSDVVWASDGVCGHLMLVVRESNGGYFGIWVSHVGYVGV